MARQNSQRHRQLGLAYNVEDVLRRLAFIRHKKQEYLISFSIDSAGQIIKRRVVTIGLLNQSLAHPREVFSGPLADRAAGVIIAHNHPSGIVEPSAEDIKTTQQLVSAGILLGMPLYDHLIVTKTDKLSFHERSLI